MNKSKSLNRRVLKNIRCKYLLFLPKDYVRQKSWPLILYLHGSGERGNNPQMVKKHGVPKIAEQQPDFPFIVVSPQCPDKTWWNTEVLKTLLDEVEQKLRVDKKRIYLTGNSMGGSGSWQLAMENPDRFAAIAPVCGRGNTFFAWRIQNIPTWVFHGAKDKIVPLAESQQMVKALRRADGNVKFTIYPKVKHDSWTPTYDNPQLYKWFLKHRRK